MAEEGYNGWKNYATWGVALVLDNDESTYNTVRERVAQDPLFTAPQTTPGQMVIPS